MDPREYEHHSTAQGETDPFSRFFVSHPALSDSHDLSSDIYYSLFDWAFKSEQFDAWVNHYISSQLRCTGGPGTGKTTLTALAAERIHDTCAKSYIATVYVVDDVLEDEQTFFEDFLYSVFEQITPRGAQLEPLTSSLYARYKKARKAGKRISTRVDTILKALRSRAAELQEAGDRCFLLVDSIDQCSPLLNTMLERELQGLRDKNVSVMVTSRLPMFEKQRDVICDFHDFDEEEEDSLVFYWRCMGCEENVICYPCHRQEKVCSKCKEDTDWAQLPYLNISIDRVHKHAMQTFVKWDLEREHGDLGLGTPGLDKPPLSSLGISFWKDETGSAAQTCTDRITNESRLSIVMAKLVLDVVHSATSVASIQWSVADRLPRNVQAIFNDGIKTIEKQSTNQRDLALKSIVAVAKTKSASQGAPLSRLAQLLRERTHTSTPKHVPPRSAEDILQAAKGYLQIIPPSFYGGTEYTIVAYNMVFACYAAEGYHDGLVWANSQLRTSNIPRSLTRADPKADINEPLISMEDILGDLKRFKVQSPPSMYSPSPSLGKESPIGDLMRSSTGLTGYFRNRQPAQKTIGLGLEFQKIP